MKNRVGGYQVEIRTGPLGARDRAEILLIGNDGTRVGRLLFHDAGEEIPKDGTHRDGTTPLLHLPYDAYGGVIDLLRNEAPIFVDMGVLSTEKEGIGEAE